MTLVEAYRDAICYEIRGDPVIALGRRLVLATLSAETGDQPRKHEACATNPNHAQHHSPTACSHIPYRPANSSKGPSPGQMRRPKPIHYRSGWHDEIECRHNPDPIFRGGAGTTD